MKPVVESNIRAKVTQLVNWVAWGLLGATLVRGVPKEIILTVIAVIFSTFLSICFSDEYYAEFYKEKYKNGTKQG